MRNSLSLLALLFLALLTAGCGRSFDYYLFSLSWSPEYCHGHPEAVECAEGKHYGFIVHGLWPQFNDGRYPEHCSDANAASVPALLAEIMPDPGLIAHEWKTHGTCTGLPSDQYFGLIRRIFDSIRIPDRLQAPERSISISPSEIKDAFTEANPKLTAASLVVSCPHNYLSGVDICVSPAGTPIPCPANGVRDCRARTIRVAPVR